MGFVEKIRHDRVALIRTVVVYLNFLFYAAAIVVPGVSLLDLEIRIQEPFSVTSRLISLHLIGYFLGSILVGFFDKYANHYLILFVSSVFSGLLTIVTPWFYQFSFMAVTMFIIGVAHSAFELESNIVLFEIWGEKVCNYIQLLHVNFGVGALMCPLIVRQFLLPSADDMEMESQDVFRSPYTPDDVQIQWPFMISGGACVLSGFLFLNFFSFKKSKVPEISEPQEEEKTKPKYSSIRIYIAVMWVCLIAHATFSIETIVCNFGQAFGVKSAVRMEKKFAALLTTVFWCAFTLSRVLFVLVSSFLGEHIMVYICLGSMFIGNILSLTVAMSNEIALFASSALLGLGSSPLFGVAFSSLEKFFHMTSRQTSIIFLCGTISCAVHAPIVGLHMDENPNFYLYYLVILASMAIVTALAFPFLCKKLFGDKPSDLPSIPTAHSTRLGSIQMVGERRKSAISVHSRGSISSSSPVGGE